MEVIYVLIPGMVLLGIILVLVLVISIRKGQYDDLEGDGSRILMDDDTMMPDAPTLEQQRQTTDETTHSAQEHHNER
ncbi:MAG: cbb3-type cytochrome oxidase assembly protein CcoS [Gammaproteobacteria bacterium]|jgi:cbb3-type cytochrome oxidase maturation protein|nr:cbb3-type cytochrome oxidase assembly protein CcoS [Thiotrichales bacterium]MBT4810845.1 cbb3-type cytochrome oxidase assembly protein CcoS [Thiotrichales bacterium]MBT5746861.1 cbb3-type cytochrome oxidase assembly protein CcoS [Gammaproteobacteria bacterium]MBT6079099.1 cbb3-type cytochrome oxidase assembly protein CcoS [Gammaproteobacteria bacterium]MBT6669156.1 cbb3-type cytochrome oxidase assembly protein CcoS [Gammaproteobacteria bacterium]